jgi:hypothetical protein
VVALGLALSLSVVVLDVGMRGEVDLFFDVAFVAVCLTVAILVRPEDFFTAGVLPPLVMLVVFALVAVSHPHALGARDAGFVATVVGGLAQHAVALGIGYAGCLLCLAIRDQFVSARRSPGSVARRRTG